MLLSESMTGSAMTAVVVCLSQAPANASQTTNALDSGAIFARLDVRRRPNEPRQRAALLEDARALMWGARAALAKDATNERYRIIRQAQARGAAQLVALLGRFEAGVISPADESKMRGNRDGPP